MDFLRDSIWQFFGAIVTVLTIIATIIIYLLQKKNKRLTYKIEQKTKIISYSDEVQGKLKIFYESTQVNEVFLVEIKFENSGNVSILPDDLKKNLSLIFNVKSKILSIEIINKKPENLEIKIQNQDNKLEIIPLLLNPSDSFCIKLIINNFSNFHIDERIVGIKKIELRTEYFSLFPKILLPISIMANLISVFDLLFKIRDYDFLEILTSITVAISLAIMVYIFGKYSRKNYG